MIIVTYIFFRSKDLLKRFSILIHSVFPSPWAESLVFKGEVNNEHDRMRS
jgi:hypothetical protein